ncbi:F-box/kelch-repeat protein-like protein [Tanacetum coccineum]
MKLQTPQVVIDGFIYHLASDYSKKGYVSNLIISFDLTREEFREIHLPESIKLNFLSISKLRETLVVFEYNMVTFSEIKFHAVWMMDNDSFTRLYTIKEPATSLDTILGFRNNGAMIIERQNDKKGNAYQRSLAIYEPDSKQITDIIGDSGHRCAFSVHSYIETLLLIDEPDGTIYKHGKRI